MERIEEAQIIRTRLKAMDIISLLIKDTVDVKAILKLAVEINEDLATLCGEKAVVNRNVRIVEKIFHHLTPEQKTLLGLPFVFRDILSRKMARFILENQP